MPLLLMDSSAHPILSDPDFCPNCGSILPVISYTAKIINCLRCDFQQNTKEHAQAQEEFVIQFNARKSHRRKQDEGTSISDKSKDDSALTGPTVARQCPRCDYELMFYTTRQTRSADEGQTVFYTCVKCKFQDIEYS